MSTFNKTRAGLNPNLTPEQLRKIFAVNNHNFKTFGKDYLTSQEALYYKTGFITPKGDSLSKRENDQKYAEQYRESNYNGFWKESGWIPLEKYQTNPKKIYLNKPRAFCPRNKLPYTIPDNPNDTTYNPWRDYISPQFGINGAPGARKTGYHPSLPEGVAWQLDPTPASTGVYIDLKWSGYQTEYDNEKYCVAGVIKKYVHNMKNDNPEKYFPPYRNYFEIFEHSGYQKFDIGNHRFYLESGYRHGQPIGYNQIFFQSGLHPSGFNNYNFLAIPNRRISDYDKRLSMIGKNYIPSNDLLNEPQNVIRYNVFFYTGELPVVYLTGQANLIHRGFGFGPVYQHKNPKYKTLVNQNYKMTFSGIYGETTTKELSIFNTGNVTERFYIGIDNPNIISINQNNIPGIPDHGVWTLENQSGKRYGEIINKVYKIGRESNINLKIKIHTRGLVSNNRNTANINIYRITGNFKPFDDKFPASLVRVNESHKYGEHGIKNLGYLSQKYSIPVEIYPKTNNTKLINDGIFYQDLQSGDYKPIFKVGKPIDINPENNSHFNLNSAVGLTFYSIGANLQDLSVSLDTMGKIQRKGIEGQG